VPIKIRRAPHGLAGVVDDEIQARVSGQDMLAESFHARRMAQIQPKDLEPIAPILEILFRGIACRRIPRETRGHDQARPRPQQFDPGLITDLDTAARQERHPAAQIGQLGAFTKIQLRANRTELIIEVMNNGIVLLADVTVLRLDHLSKRRIVGHLLRFEVGRRRRIRRDEGFFPAQLPDARFLQNILIPFQLLRLAPPHPRLDQAPPLAHVRTINVAGGLQQTRAFLHRQ
jgi:hypothetical protein